MAVTGIIGAGSTYLLISKKAKSEVASKAKENQMKGFVDSSLKAILLRGVKNS